MFSQYGEEEVLLHFFGKKEGGILVDVGASDGVKYSNSRYLITHLGWKALLVEPHPVSFSSLEEIYKHNENIILKNLACFDSETTVDFYMYDQGDNACLSTISKSFKQRVINAYGDKFAEPIKVESVTLETLLSNYEHVDFLSVDCEGADMQVLKSNNWEKHRPSLICIEHSMDESVLQKFAKDIKYTQYARTSGNTFFKDSQT